ncbi:response regulator transcription factor [Chryseobacterium potabilaquae]|uniref:Oxygen regulatory protein NreC n=1 Tax=Chryseobacterium potabilaquae TaxID=2675057 RepID=A0A6N4XCL8_9FLAO|nr:response regulator transcription factor [Chryseobacterium potabilaquae]CAA7197413.1 Oxygen regulatory protein NreC [Chryseobacterium potabilaquae]
MNKRVLIADKQDVSIKGISFILQTIHHDMVIDRVYNKQQLMEKVMEKAYDFLILDITLLEHILDSMIKNIKEMNPELKVVIFVGFTKGEGPFRYLYEGVDALVYKSYDELEIRMALYSLFKRGYYYPQELLYDFIHISNKPISSPLNLDILSEREKEVYFHLVKGAGLLEISNTLGLHQSTVSVYKARLFKKLKCKSLVDLINYDRYMGTSSSEYNPDGKY